MSANDLKIGDRLIRPKGLIKHHAIYVGVWGGKLCVAENQSGKGVQIVPYNQFMWESKGGMVSVKPFGGTEEERAYVVPRIEALIGMNYNLLFFNCEHFAEFVQSGKPISKQVGAVVFGTIVLLGCLALQAD